MEEVDDLDFLAGVRGECSGCSHFLKLTASLPLKRGVWFRRFSFFRGELLVLGRVISRDQGLTLFDASLLP